MKQLNHNRAIWGLVTLLLIEIILIQLSVGYSLITWKWLGFLLLPIGFYCFAKVFLMLSKPLYHLCLSLTYLSIISPLLGFSPFLIPLSPHPVIDPVLKALDGSVGFSVAVFMHWFQEMPRINDFMWIIYNSLIPQLSLTFLLLPFIDFKGVQRFYLLLLLSFILMLGFTYFFPSVSPCYSYHGFQFAPSLQKEAHAYLSFRSGGAVPLTDDVSCPSYHVITALILIAGWWNVKKYGIRYFVLALNLLMILSTLTTGAHYLTDVIAGILFFIACFYLIKLLERTYGTSNA